MGLFGDYWSQFKAPGIFHMRCNPNFPNHTPEVPDKSQEYEKTIRDLRNELRETKARDAKIIQKLKDRHKADKRRMENSSKLGESTGISPRST